MAFGTDGARFFKGALKPCMSGSMAKLTLKRRSPGFNESFKGFRSFNEVLEEACLLELERDGRSGSYSIIQTVHGDG